MRNRFMQLPFFATLALLAWAGTMPAAAQNDMAPPAGAFSNGMPIAYGKSMSDIEPRTHIEKLPFLIGMPGSYYLSQTLVCSQAIDGITIASGDVSLDLNGFSLIGMNIGSNGIVVVGPRHNISIFRGVLRDWNGLGVQAEMAVESRLHDVVAFQNKLGGMHLGDNGRINDCGAYKNDATGIIAGSQSTVTGCKALDNTGSTNVHGISVGSYCRVEACITVNNQGAGIEAEGGCTIQDNNRGKNNMGIQLVESGNRVSRNNLPGNSSGGIKSRGGNLIVGNSASGPPPHYITNPDGDQVGTVLSGASPSLGMGEPWANFSIPASGP